MVLFSQLLELEVLAAELPGAGVDLVLELEGIPVGASGVELLLELEVLAAELPGAGVDLVLELEGIPVGGAGVDLVL
jgi:hypothetical protein